MNPIFSSPRTFQLWSYTVSHRQLLLRSTKDDKWASQIDILFTAVKFMSIETLLEGITVETTTTAGGEVAFDVSSSGVRGHLVAAEMVTDESDLEYFDASPLLER